MTADTLSHEWSSKDVHGCKGVVALQVELLYADKNEVVLDQSIMEVTGHTDLDAQGKASFEVKVKEVSNSHPHNKRTFRLRIRGEDGSSNVIEPCLTSPFKVMSKKSLSAKKKRARGQQHSEFTNQPLHKRFRARDTAAPDLVRDDAPALEGSVAEMSTSLWMKNAVSQFKWMEWQVVGRTFDGGLMYRCGCCGMSGETKVPRHTPTCAVNCLLSSHSTVTTTKIPKPVPALHVQPENDLDAFFTSLWKEDAKPSPALEYSPLSSCPSESPKSLEDGEMDSFSLEGIFDF